MREISLIRIPQLFPWILCSKPIHEFQFFKTQHRTTEHYADKSAHLREYILGVQFRIETLDPEQNSELHAKYTKQDYKTKLSKLCRKSYRSKNLDFAPTLFHMGITFF